MSQPAPPAAAHGPAPLPPPLPDPVPVALDPGGPPTRFRWVVLGLVFLAITVNYIDRMVMGLLAPDLKVRFHISDTEYGYIAGTCFGLAYAVGQLVSGRWLDWVGTRVGYAIALLSWSVASMLHAFAGSAVGFGVARALLGITESPAYPAATKTLAEWFPRKERAFAMGVVNAGANIGAVVAPLLVTWLAMRFGWQAAFLVTGTAGLAWLALWLPIYRLPQDHPRVNRAELAVIEQDPPEAPGRVRWAALLAKRQSWAFMLGKFLTDPVWSFYLFWLPLFLKDQHRMEPAAIAWAMATVYIIADLGSIAGGWMSSAMIRQGFSVNAARKSTLAACAAVAVPAVLVPSFATPWPAVLICGFALAAHQGFSTNLYTLVSDMYPKRAVGSVAGMGGTCGYIGTAILLPAIGKILDATGKNYTVVFLICGLAYLLSFALIHLLAPGLAQARFDDGDDQPGGPGAGGFEVVPRPAPPPGAEH